MVQDALKRGFMQASLFGANQGHAEWSGVNVISLIDDIHDPNAVFKSWTWDPKGETRKGGKAIGSAQLGYQLVNSFLYLAGELSYTLSSRETFCENERRKFTHVATLGLPPYSTVSGTSDLQAKVTFVRNELNLDLKPGFLPFKSLLLYARGGAAFSLGTPLKIDNSGKWTEIASETGLQLSAKKSSYNTKNTIGFRVGGGGEYLITKHLGITIDYIATYYGRVKTRAEAESSGFFDFNHVYGLSAPEVTVTTHAILAGFLVHF